MYSVWTYNDIVRSNLHNKGDGFIALEGLGDRILSTTKKIETHFISDKTSNFILIYWGLYKTSGSIPWDMFENSAADLLQISQDYCGYEYQNIIRSFGSGK